MASAELAADYVELFEDMRTAWHGLPAPQGMQLSEISRASLSDVEAISVMYGWMCRIIRTGEAVLKSSALGYTVELSPLRRSMIEHAIGLWWVADQRGIAFQVLIRRRSRSMQILQNAQANGWQIEGEGAQILLQQAIDIETDQETLTHDNLGAVAYQALAYGLGDLYQAWLLETHTSHATIASAHPYYSYEENNNNVQLHPVPLETGTEVEASVVIPVILALTAYNQILDGEPLNDQIPHWSERFVALQRRLEEENG